MYSPDNKLLVTGSSDWTCRTWDALGAGKERFTPWSHISYVYSSSISPDCQTLASGSLDKVLRLWDVNRPDPRTRNYLKGDSIPLYNVVYSPDGTRLAASGNTGAIRQWESATGKTLRGVTGLGYYPAVLSYSPDGKNLLGFGGPTAYLYDAQTMQPVREFTGHTTTLFSANLSPDGKKLITSAGTYLYDKNGKIVEIDRVPQYTDTTARIWDVEKFGDPVIIKDHKLPVYRSFFSPDGKYVYTGAQNDATLTRREVSNPAKGEPAFPGLPVNHCTYQFSPDGTKLLSTYGGYALKLWDMESGKSTWGADFQEQIGNVTFASDSRHLAVSLATGVIYILRLAPPEGK
jgi:WD40 repeat protein